MRKGEIGKRVGATTRSGTVFVSPAASLAQLKWTCATPHSGRHLPGGRAPDHLYLYKSKENYDDNSLRRPGDIPQHHRRWLP
jgi:hypothetical protein